MTYCSYGHNSALRVLHSRADLGRGFISDPFWGDEAAGLGLRRMDALLDGLGRPDRQYSIIHVAGSKGKGSTCTFAASILGAAGYQVGLTTSPHLHTYRERIVSSGAMISEEAFATLLVRVEGQATALERQRPEIGRFTAFELLTAMALDHFAAVSCDVAVVEVGMGGALDSTNVIIPTVSVITTLDYEHTAVLGSTLSEIAGNKAGIIKPGRPVVVAEQQADALGVINAAARRNDAPLWLAGRDWDVEGDWRRFTARGPWGALRELRSGIAGDHQMGNAALALAAVTASGSTLSVPAAAARDGIGMAALPGRFEVVKVDGHTVVLDGAHTPLAATALTATFQEAFVGQRAVLVLGMAGDKPAEEIAAALAPVAEVVVATYSASPRAMETSKIVEAFHSHTATVHEGDGIAAALDTARRLAGSENPILVAGSFNVVAEAREVLGLAEAGGTP